MSAAAIAAFLQQNPDATLEYFNTQKYDLNRFIYYTTGVSGILVGSAAQQALAFCSPARVQRFPVLWEIYVAPDALAHYRFALRQSRKN
jgi:hypothetical protein